MILTACTACAKDRRKCGKQKPHCLRCRARGTKCCYPATKRSSFVELVDQVAATQPSSARLPDTSITRFPSAVAAVDCLVSSWFMSPATWTLDAIPPRLTSGPGRFSMGDLNRMLNRMIGWMKQWSEQGSNPFIHHELYRHRSPSCIQDAYTSLSCYSQMTAANRHLVYRIIEDRATQLVSQGSAMSNPSVVGRFDTLECLARVQALLIYQIICLYDGNVHVRLLAEKHIPVLESWLQHLFEHSRHVIYTESSSILMPTEEKAAHLQDSASSLPHRDLLWHSWIIAESTRRTWLVSSTVHGIYKLINNRTGTCLGGTVFTCRKGFWEAPSAVAWEKQCSEMYAGLLRLTEVEKMFALVPLRDINEFAKTMLQCTYGVEQASCWGVHL